MAGERIKLTVRERDSRGSADARRLRKQGFIPGVLYGKGKSSYAIAVPERELRRVLTGAGGLHAIPDVSGMAIGDSLRLADLAPIDGVSYLDDPEETVLASVGLPAREIEPEPEEPVEGEELPEGEVPEGEAAEGAAEGEAPAAEAGS